MAQLLRTGMGAMEGSKSWNLYKRSLGPTIETLFFQGSFGVVTKLGVWLMPKPEVITHVHVDVERDEDLIPLVYTLRRLRLDGTIDGIPCILNTLLIAATIAPRVHRHEPEEGVIPDHVIDEIAAKIRHTVTGKDEWASLEDPSDRVYAGVPNLDWNTMAGWRGVHGPRAGAVRLQ